MSLERLQAHRDAWQRKPMLRKLYESWFVEVAARLVPGFTVELGSGPGFFKEFHPTTLSTDVIVTPWIDVAADGTGLPLRDGSVSNLVMFDVLHHLADVQAFFEEASRVLRPSGRVVIFDVHLSPLSFPVYHFFHHEPVKCGVDPFRPTDLAGKDPFDSNQALTTLLFGKYFFEFRRRNPGLRLRERMLLGFWAYPLIGGFEHPSFLPACLEPLVMKSERWLRPFGLLSAFRTLVVLERL